MIREKMIFVATSDIAGKLRGKAFPAVDIDKRLRRGVGWTPTNVQITCFDAIAESPYGALGDLLLVPDPNTEVKLDFMDGEPADRVAIRRLILGIVDADPTDQFDVGGWRHRMWIDLDREIGDPRLGHLPA